MALANKFTQPIDYYGEWGQVSWAGYIFKELLGYTSGRHTGDDYNGPGAGNNDLGMEIRSIANGIVRWTGNRNDLGFGNVIIVEHTLSPTLAAEAGCTSLFSRYMHCNTIEVINGQQVSVGQRIGSVGNTGTQWAHLHLDLYKNTIDGGGIHFRYDNNTQLLSYYSPYNYIQGHLNPVDIEQAIQPHQRQVENAGGVNERAEPNISSTITRDFAKDEVLDMKGFTRGQTVNNSDIWFVGAYAGKYFHSSMFTNKTTSGLADLTPKPTIPAPTIEQPLPAQEYIFPADFSFVNEVFPAAIGNFEYGNFPTNPSGIILHDYGTAGVHTYASLKNEFTKIPITEKSIHLAFSGAKVGQNVKIGDRAYHAGPTGNVNYGFEIDPLSKDDPVTTENVKKAIDALQKKHNKKLTLYLHSQFMDTECGDDITLSKYDVPFGENPPEPTPTPVPNEPSDIDKENNNLLKQILALLTDLVNRFKGVFK